MVTPDWVASNITSRVPTFLALICSGYEHAFGPSLLAISAINSLSACAGFVSLLNHGVFLHGTIFGESKLYNQIQNKFQTLLSVLELD